MLVSFSVALRITFLLLFLPSGHQHHVINPLVILHIIVTCLLHEVEILFLDREGFLVYNTYICVLGRQYAWPLGAQSVASSDRGHGVTKGLTISSCHYMWFANFLKNIMA